ncbi:hypothetical protein CNO08_03275 [Lysobacter capsici]|nr:hypothetical protein CNO08_03275 [Lysobacter capsici]
MVCARAGVTRSRLAPLLQAAHAKSPLGLLAWPPRACKTIRALVLAGHPQFVIPAKVGIQRLQSSVAVKPWIPTFAGMTIQGMTNQGMTNRGMATSCDDGKT